MNPARFFRHLWTGAWSVRRAFPSRVMDAITREIRAAEATHCGEIAFAVEASLDFWRLVHGESAQERALEVFSGLRIWDTEHNNGVLVFLLLADRDVEIIADRGIHVRCGPQVWEEICRRMETEFRAGRFEEGVTLGVRAIGEHLARHYPGDDTNPNELPDQPVIIRG